MRTVRPVDLSALPAAGLARQVLAGPGTGIESCEIAFCRMPTGTADAGLFGVDRMLLVLTGAVTLSVGELQRRIAAGTFVLLPPGTQHRLSNDGGEPATFLDVLAPLPDATAPQAAPPLSAADLDRLIRPVREDAFAPHTTRTVQGTPLGMQVLADRDSGSRAARVFAASIPPGSGTDRHIHMFDQFYYVLSGSFSVEVGTATHHAAPGSLVVLPAATIHRNWNEGGEPILELTILTPEPPAGVPRTIPATLQLAEPPRGS